METRTEQKSGGGGCGCFGWVVVIVILLFFVDVFFSGTKPAKEAYRRMMCTSNQRQILCALQNYYSVYNQFPPACVKDKNGKPLYSWRVLILPFMEESGLYDQFHLDEPWDSPHNKEIAETDMPVFRCPSCESEVAGRTNYVLVTGPGTLWDGDKRRSLMRISSPKQTILLVEVADPTIHWAEPKDLRIDAIDPDFWDEEGKFKSNHSGGAVGTFADGHSEFISEEDIPKALQEWSQIKQKKREREE